MPARGTNGAPVVPRHPGFTWGDPVGAVAVDLRRLADDVADIPYSGLIAAAKASKRIADDVGRRVAGPDGMKGKKRRGLRLRARDDIRRTSTGARVRIQGVSPAAWVWATTGTRPHTIRRRKRGPLRKMTVPHPGTAGRGAWWVVVARIEDAVPLLFASELGRVVGRG